MGQRPNKPRAARGAGEGSTACPRPLPGVRAGTRLGVLVGPTRYADAGTQAVRYCLDLLDLDAETPEIERITLGFFAHGFAPHPRRPAEAVLFEKRGGGACYVDLVARRVLRAIAPHDGCAFYGHGVFTRDGAHVLAIEMDRETRDGLVSVRDGETFALLDRFPTYGAAPHDCALIEAGRTLVITNGGGPIGGGARPSVTFVDVATQKLVERHEVRIDRINAGHVALGRGREFAMVSAPREGLSEETSLGGVSLRRGTEPWVHMSEPEGIVARMLGESLSVCLHTATGTLAVTNPYGDLVTFWDLDTRKLRAHLEMPVPRGVTLTRDGRYFAIAYGQAASLALLDARTLAPKEGHDPGTRRFGGSHLFTWAYPA